jgi:serine/threonine protein kinase
MNQPRAKSVFLELLDAEPVQRAALIGHLCQGDEVLEKRVRELLEAHERATAVLRDPSSVPTLDSSVIAAIGAAPMKLGSKIGPYTIVRMLGEGGFGTVYEARQESPVRRTVALKVIRPGMGSRDVIARFEAERQALAVMDHPGIARVFDAGTTELGLPYFVMEYVDGAEITEFCDSARLGIDERIELFEQVCHAVQHAHAKGVIHRDLKPSNILVTRVDEKPFAKVIDFGIAKVLNIGAAGDSKLTLPSQIVGTPLYMAPEQASSETIDIDARADVYSLGAILYELLSGVPPIQPERLSRVRIAEIERIIREEDAPRPSVRVRAMTPEERGIVAAGRAIEPSKLAGKLEDDLDWIVNRALEKQRERRYGAPLALAADLHRYLRDEPVEAGPPTASYRLAKFARRHRFEMIAACVTLAALVAFAMGGSWFAWREHESAERARKDRDRADALALFSQRILAGVDPAEARGLDTTLLRRILNGAMARVDKELASEPESQVAILNAVGFAAMQVGELEQAVSAFERAAGLSKSHLAETNVLAMDAQANLAAAYSQLQRFKEADEAQRAVIELRKRVLGPEHPDTLNAMSNLAYSYDRQGRWQEAKEMLEKLLEIHERTLGPEHEDTLKTLNNLATTLDMANETPRAVEILERVLSVQSRVDGDDHPRTLATMNNLAGAYQTLGRSKEATALYERSIAAKRTILDATHPSLITSLINLGVVYLDGKQFEDAERVLTEAVDSSMKAGESAMMQRVGSLNAMGRLRREQGKHAEAVECIERCLEAVRGAFGEDHPNVVTIASNLAAAEYEAGYCGNAAGHAREAIELAGKINVATQQAALNAKLTLARCMVARGQREDAKVMLASLSEDLKGIEKVKEGFVEDVRKAREECDAGVASKVVCVEGK